jgi:hypothetical protein
MYVKFKTGGYNNVYKRGKRTCLDAGNSQHFNTNRLGHLSFNAESDIALNKNWRHQNHP